MQKSHPQIPSNYDAKKAYFDHQRENPDEGKVKIVEASQQACDFLNAAARVRETTEKTKHERLSKACGIGGIAKDTSNEEICNYSKKVAFHT